MYTARNVKALNHLKIKTVLTLGLDLIKFNESDNIKHLILPAQDGSSYQISKHFA